MQICNRSRKKNNPRHGKYTFTGVDVCVYARRNIRRRVSFNIGPVRLEKLIYGFRYMHIDSLYTLDQLIHDLATIE